MADIKRIPNVLVHEFLSGASISGVTPEGDSYSFDYDNEAGGPFTLGEALSWTGGTGLLAELVDDGATGSMVIVVDSGVAPSDGLEITGGDSSATCDVDGVVTSGGLLDSNESVRRGRYRRYHHLIDGGLVDIDDINASGDPVAWNGHTVRNVLVSAPGITAVNFFIVDRDGNDVFAGTASVASGNAYYEWRNKGILVAPGCKFKIVGTGTLSDTGRVMFVIDKGWAASTFDDDPQLGKSNRPAGMVRP